MRVHVLGQVALSAGTEAALFAFIKTDDLAKAWRLVLDHPDLLSDLGLDKAHRVVAEQVEEKARRRVAERLWLLQRCRQIGVDAAFRSLFRAAPSVTDDDPTVPEIRYDAR